MKEKHEQRLQGGETRKEIARKKKHETGLQGRRYTKPECEEGETRKEIARKNINEN